MTSSVAARTAAKSPPCVALAGMAQQHERHGLTRHVPTLAPTGQLVVGQLGQRRREGRRLGVEVHLRLPPLRRHGRRAGRAVDQRDGAPEPAGQRGGRRARHQERIPAPSQRSLQPPAPPPRGRAPTLPGPARPAGAPSSPPARRAPWNHRRRRSLLERTGVGHQGSPASAARAASAPLGSPPTATTVAPRSTAFSAAVSVSAVPPEDETARTSVSAPTKAGTADP